ncbi:hypothetical protein [Desertibacillus haloalkaliphilus]|uniref:hypothetical protein n=1 Tax=Desertibacillus haloalkaliphilus TaxID=1328930 RepID=UPI001C26E74A|nr:hypothetical protein [Desertibacillus haloalkaliphilus]MBU8906839.1 hypothetical protein [Desertibacillus haloalkaliphilus]
MVKWWIALNGLFLICVLGFSWQKEYLSMMITTSKGIAQAALVFFLLNVNMFFIFLIIRKSKNRNIKKALAKGSRKFMKLHIPIAITGTALVIVHAALMLMHHPSSFTSLKFISGYFAFIVLVVLLITGYRRHKKATGMRRKLHITMAFFFLFIVSLHIFN